MMNETEAAFKNLLKHLGITDSELSTDGDTITPYASLIITDVSFNEFVCCLDALPSDSRGSIVAVIMTLEDLLPWMLKEFRSTDDINDVQYAAVKSKKNIEIFFDLLYHHVGVEQFVDREDIGYQKEDFDGVAWRATSVMKGLIRFVSVLENACYSEQNVDKNIKFIINVVSYRALLVCMEHYSPHLWTDGASNAEAIALLHAVCSANCCSLEELLSGSSVKNIPGFFPGLLADLQPKLSKSVWKLNPTTPHVFYHCLTHVRFPHLSDHLGSVLPPSLIFADDFQVEFKLLGMNCLKHIMDNVSKAELRWYGRSEVVYDCLRKLLYSREGPILPTVVPCLFSILDIVEPSQNKADHVRSETRYDEIFRHFLRDMELENLVIQRRVYSRFLSNFIEKLGITAVRHMNKTLRVIENYLDVYDGPQEQCRLNILEALRVLINQTWPRISFHSQTILKILLKFIYDISTDNSLTPSDVKLRMLESAVNCVKLLMNITPRDEICDCVHAVAALGLNDSFNDCIKDIVKL